MDKILSIFLCLALALPSQAKTVVRAANADPFQFRGWLTTRPDLKLASEDFLPDQKKKDQFNSHLERAQSLFLNGSLAEAKSEFEKLVSLAFEEDWGPAQREAIHFAYLRLAQMTDEPQGRNQALRNAISFAPDLKIDAAVFPPPLLLKFNETAKAMKAKVRKVVLKDHFATFDQLYLNGRKHEIESGRTVYIFPGRHRVRLVSDTHESFVTVVDANQIAKLRPSLQAHAEGNCETPKIKTSIATTVYFNDDCLYENQNGSWHRLEATNATSDWDKFSVQPQPQKIFSEIRQPKKSLTKSPWFWGGIAGVAVIAVAMIAKKPERETEPTVIPTAHTGY